MPVVLALDLGSRWIGVAVGSTETRLARPLTTLRAQGKAQLVRQLQRIVQEQQASLLVVGCPQCDQPQERPGHQELHGFAQALAEGVGLPLVLRPEVRSTLEAQEKLLEAGFRRSERRVKEHAAAAAVVLQEYLESLGRPGA